MATLQLPDTFVPLNTEEAHRLVCIRAEQLAGRRLVDVTDLVELEMLVKALTGNCNVIFITTIWRAVLSRHNHAYVPLDDHEGNYQHEPYASYRQQALTVYRRLEALAAGDMIVEDELVRYPDGEEAEAANQRRIDALLAWVAEQVNAIYDSAGHLEGEALMGQLEYEARHAIEHRFAKEWFDDTYALGSALMRYPTMGSSPFGRYRSQTALIRALANIIIEATMAIHDTSRSEEDRVVYGHRITLFWPLLKGIVYAAANEMNSPASGFDDDLLEAIKHALLDGRQVYPEVDKLDSSTRGWSESGTEVYQTPTEDVIDQLFNRAAQERHMKEQMARMR